MKVAVVGLNSLYPCGASAFMLHLTHQSDWQLIIANKTGWTENGDMLLQKRISRDVLFSPYANLDIVLSGYDVILFAASRWGGDYNFLDETAKMVKHNKTKVGFIVHDTTEFDRMSMQILMNMFNNHFDFCFDDTVKMCGDFTKIKHPYNPYYIKGNGTIDGNKMSDRDCVLIPTRDSPSKHRDETLLTIPLYIPTVVFGKRNMVGGKNIKFTNLNYNRAMMKNFGHAVAIIDGSKLPTPHHRTQYTFMDAWLFNCAVICNNEWFDNDDMIPGKTCLELNYDNINMSWEDRTLSRSIGENGKWKLMVDHRSEDVRKDILEYIQ